MSGVERTANSRANLLPKATLIFLLALGLAIRLYDLTDLPLAFHPTRQLRSAITARGMYYENLESAPDWKREMATRQQQAMEQLEPTIVERIIAVAYRLAGGEYLWFGRLFSILVWVASAALLYLLARDISSIDGALIAVAYYLFLPFSVEASRSFQPDPLMVALVVAALWMIYRWFSRDAPDWRITLVTGLITGLALIVKVGASFIIFGALAGAVLSRKPIKKTMRNPKIWAIISLSLILVVPYYIYGVYISHEIVVGSWPLFALEFITDLRFYLDWQAFVMPMVGFGAVIVALIGIFGLRDKDRGLMIGLWLGFFVYGIAFPYHATTHSYYSLPLVPLIALGLAWPSSLLLNTLAGMNKTRLWRGLIAGTLLLALAVQLRTSRGIFAGRDFRSETGYWEHIGDLLEHRSDVIEISHNYGFRLEYFGWVTGGLWTDYNDPDLSEAIKQGASSEAATSLRNRLENHSYLVVTILSELDANPIIKEFLYKTYPVFEQGEDFVIFDLHP